MKNFLQICNSVDVRPLLTSIYNQPDLWNQNLLRTTHPESPHQHSSDIWVWFNRLSDNDFSVIDDIQTIPYKAWNKLPQLRPIVFDLMRVVEATQLGRVIISKLPPGKIIPSHIDQGAPAEYYSRFQFCLQTGPGCNFIIEDEQVQFNPGEIWWINNNKEHSVVNNSSVDRISVVIDLRCS